MSLNTFGAPGIHFGEPGATFGDFDLDQIAFPSRCGTIGTSFIGETALGLLCVTAEITGPTVVPIPCGAIGGGYISEMALGLVCHVSPVFVPTEWAVVNASLSASFAIAAFDTQTELDGSGTTYEIAALDLDIETTLTGGMVNTTYVVADNHDLDPHLV